jgi:hypothetical protein
MFLSEDDLEQLTGYVRASEQVRWLRRHGILFWVNARGRPVVPRDAVSGRPAEKQMELGAVP